MGKICFSITLLPIIKGVILPHWKDNKKHIPPEFEDISFKVNGDVQVELYMND
jgi:hypothetical protein